MVSVILGRPQARICDACASDCMSHIWEALGEAPDLFFKICAVPISECVLDRISGSQGRSQTVIVLTFLGVENVNYGFKVCRGYLRGDI